MKKLSIIVIVLLSALLLRPQRTVADNLHIEVKPYTPQDYIVAYAKAYKVSEKLLLAVAKCESGFDETVKGDNGEAYGIFQFHLPTFNTYEKKLGEDLDYHNTKDQAQLAAYMFSIGQTKHWTCYKKVV